MEKTTEHLVDFAIHTDYQSLSPAVVQEVKRHFIDTIGCALGALDEPMCRAMHSLAAEYSIPAQATLWGTSIRCSADMAAFANGVLIRIQDFNDTFSTVDGGHPSDIISGIVAAGEANGASGRDLIAAIAIGYEVYCRFMQTAPVAECNFDQTVNVVVAAAVAIGKLYRLTPEQLGHAISLALTPNLGLRQTRQGQLSAWKGAAAANATRQALFAVILAARGITGPSDVFEGKQGLWSIIGPRQWAEPSRWRELSMIGQTYLKSIPVCYHAQAPSQAAIELCGRIAGRQVSSIDIETYAEAWQMIGSDASRWNPKSRETADHSMPFVVATSLLKGRLTVGSFDDTGLADPEVRALMARVTVRESPRLTALYPDAAPAAVRVTLGDGQVVSAEVVYPKGHPKDPLSDTELERKFEYLLQTGGKGVDGAGLLARLWSLDGPTTSAAALAARMANPGASEPRENKEINVAART